MAAHVRRQCANTAAGFGPRLGELVEIVAETPEQIKAYDYQQTKAKETYPQREVQERKQEIHSVSHRHKHRTKCSARHHLGDHRKVVSWR